MLSFSEMLKGNQHKIDKNKNGKIDAHDFKLLKKMKKEEVDVEEGSCGCSQCSCSSQVEEGIVDVVKNVISKERAYQAQKQKKAGEVLSKLKKEEVETIDELSKSTLGSYIKKATSDAADKARQSERRAAHAKDSEKRAKDPKLAFASNMNKDLAKHDMKKSADATKKSMKREIGVGKAVSRLTKEEAALDEKFINGREYASQGVMHPDHAKMDIHKKTGKGVDFYASKTGDKMHGTVTKNDGKEVHIQAHKELGDGKLHKFKVTPHLPKSTNEEVELDEKLNVAASSMGTVIKDFKKSDAPQFAGKSVEKRRQMAIAAKLQADRMKKEGVEMKSYRQFMEELVSKLPEETELDEAEKATGGLKDACWKGYTAVGMKMKNGKKVPNCVPVKEEAVDEEVEQIDELDINLLKAMQKHAKANPRPKTSSDAIDPKTGKLKPYGYRGKSEYEKSETGDDEEPQKRGRKTGVSVGSYKRRQPK